MQSLWTWTNTPALKWKAQCIVSGPENEILEFKKQIFEISAWDGPKRRMRSSSWVGSICHIRYIQFLSKWFLQFCKTYKIIFTSKFILQMLLFYIHNFGKDSNIEEKSLLLWIEYRLMSNIPRQTAHLQLSVNAVFL